MHVFALLQFCTKKNVTRGQNLTTLCCCVVLCCPCVLLQAKQDMEQVKQIASGAVSKLSNMAGRFMNDLSRY